MPAPKKKQYLALQKNVTKALSNQVFLNSNENNQTVDLWVDWLRNNCKLSTIFDSRSSTLTHRPDIQIWLNDQQKSARSAPIWLEAKNATDFRKKRAFSTAAREVEIKIKRELEAGSQSSPPSVIISDIEQIFFASSASLQAAIRAGTNISSVFQNLVVSETGEEGRLEFLAFLKDALSNDSQSSGLDIDTLVHDLVAVSRRFNRDVLPNAFSTLRKNTDAKQAYSTWIDHGGDTTLGLIKSDSNQRKKIGDEETFAELCFHSFLVRIFAIKWCLDNNFLDGTKLSSDWAEGMKSGNLNKVIRPTGRSPVEQILKKVFRSTDMYMWIVEILPGDISVSLHSSFNRQDMRRTETDILGIFYQKYLSLYSKKAQFELGQFYTPHALVRAMWAMVERHLNSNDKSLKHKSTLIIDPSAGTGTFLTQGYRYALSKGWVDRLRHGSKEAGECATRFFGLEINPFSKGVADINFLTEILSHCKSIKPENIPIPTVFETNSYQAEESVPKSIKNLNEATSNWVKRWKKSAHAKKSKYTIVVGNPPWRNPSPALKNEDLANTIRNKLIPWAFNFKGRKLSEKRGCNHGIRDEYAYFFGVANQLIQDKGLLCYVTNESWLMGDTYWLFRKYLVNHYAIKTVIRVGPYFKGVQEKACVVLMERSDKANEQQEIEYIDWSDKNNPEYTHSWINSKVSTLISGKIKRGDIKKIRPSGDGCVLLPLETPSSIWGIECSYIEIGSLYEKIYQGAQSGFTPLFINSNEKQLLINIRDLLSGSSERWSKIAEKLAHKTRGGKKAALGLIKKAYDRADQSGAKFKSDFVREILVYNASKKTTEKSLCYYDPRVWLFPRAERDPKKTSIWDFSKVAFRDVSDHGKTPKNISCSWDESGMVIDNHALNGGSQILCLDKTLTKLKPEYSKIKLTSVEWMDFIFTVLNSQYAKEWGQKNPRQRMKLPIDKKIEKVMKALASVGKKYRNLPFHTKISEWNQFELKRLEEMNLKTTQIIHEAGVKKFQNII